MGAVAPASAQRLVPQTGLHYYAIERIDDRAVILRGKAGSQGVAFENLILPPETRIRAYLIQAKTLRTGFVEVTTPTSGNRFTIPPIVLKDDTSLDTDNDGLRDTGEYIMGTNASKADSDGDGVRDGAEVRQGTNPLDGRPVVTGIVAAVDTPGQALDVAAFNDIAVVADGTSGVTVFNVFNGMDPRLIAQVNTPGTAQAVAFSDTLIAVADGPSGLAVLDLADPPAASILHQVSMRGAAEAVATAGNLAFVGLRSGEVSVVDMRSGTVLEVIQIGAPVHDLMVEGDHLYVLRHDELQVYALVPGAYARLSKSATSGFGPEGITQRKRLFVGGGVAYATAYPGYDTFDVSDPAQIQPLGRAVDSGPNSFKQIIVNGSGRGIAAVGVNPRSDGTHDVWTYDVKNPLVTNALLSQFPTPGTTRAVSIYNGLAYAADGENGLQVLNYVAFDTGDTPPTITLATNFSENRAEEGQIFRVSAQVADDVQVRNVEFIVNGRRLATDGNFPFEFRFVTPRIEDGPSFRLQARASDTGGNTTLTDERVIQLVEDATSPTVRSVTPPNNAFLQTVLAVSATLSEPLNGETLTPDSFAVFSAGPDGAAGTGDDVRVTAGTRLYREEARTVLLSLRTPLPPGLYRAVAQAPLADRKGNALSAPFAWTFRVVSREDADGDGVPDEIEPLLNLNPAQPDTDGDTVPDGDEDFDNDGLANRGEFIMDTDPTHADTDRDGVRDGDEDFDLDSLTDSDEVRRGTNPRNPDTDGDGWPDEVEINGESDPLVAASTPRLFFAAAPPVTTVLSGVDPEVGLPFNVTVAAPPVTTILSGFGAAGVGFGTTVAAPPVTTVLSGLDPATDLPFNITLANPPVTTILSGFGAAGEGFGTTVASPPVTAVLSGTGGDTLPFNTTLAQPPVRVRFQMGITSGRPLRLPAPPTFRKTAPRRSGSTQ